PASVHPTSLPSFPTRRSSDLLLGVLCVLCVLPFLILLHRLGRQIIHPGADLGVGRRAAEHDSIRLLNARRIRRLGGDAPRQQFADRKSTRLNSSHVSISYAVF